VKNLAIARRYAKALLIIAREDGRADIYREELDGMVSLLDREKALARAITNPLYGAASRRGVLTETLLKLNLSQMMTSFLLLLFDKGRIGFLGSINTYYQQFADELKGVARAELVSATPLSDQTVDKIKKSLSKMTGKAIVLDMIHDPGLIGGVVTKIGDLILDGSIKTQLMNMKESLKRGERV